VALPLSVKGVLLVEGAVVLVRNGRDEWELPGGRLDPGETHEQTLVREFKEELAIDVAPRGFVDSYDFEVIPSKHVHIVTYGCALLGEFRPALSAEHTAFGLHALADLERIALPAGYVRSIRAWSLHAQP
jgi:8-oxo-dGTP pyrophosphatase MutT (NUDIX family)